MFGYKTLSALIALAALAAAPTASAQEWNFSIGKRTKHGQVSVDFGTRRRAPHARRYESHRGRRVAIGHRQHPRHIHGESCYTAGGYFEKRADQVFVPGIQRRVWVPARYEYYTDRWGITRQRQACGGRYETYREPGHYETRYRKAWVQRRLICRY